MDVPNITMNPSSTGIETAHVQHPPVSSAISFTSKLACVNISSDESIFEDIDLDTGCDSSETSDEGVAWNAIDNITALGLSFDPDIDSPNPSEHSRFSIESRGPIKNHVATADQPFNKWMKTIHRRAQRQLKADKKTVSTCANSTPFPQFDGPSEFHHKKSSSGSSLGFVTAIKSASISLASFSIGPRSRRTKISSRHFANDGSSRVSNAGPRHSEDSSHVPKRDSMDVAIVDRSIQRRRVLEEFISTEENYVADLRFLMQVCLPIPPFPTSYQN